MISRDQLDIRQHAAQRMLERNISVADVLVVVNSGETIENYPEDMPFPSRLTLRMDRATTGARGVGHGGRHGPNCDHHGL